MIQILVNKQLRYFRLTIIHSLLLTFGVSVAIPPQLVQAQSMAILPAPGVMLNTSAAFTPAMMTGMTINPENPLEFDFIIDTGDHRLEGNALNQESKKLINYFLTTLTVPDDQLWVNLSPNEANRIIADDLVKTEMGRDMLAQDYLLKQLMASLMYPEEKTGREFWKRVHQQAYERFGTTDIPTNTFNKIWIVPQNAHVHVHDQNVFVVDSRLKVLLEEDYLSLKAHSAEKNVADDQWDETTKEMIRTVLIPEIEKEINEGENFANLRQIYQSMLLATWYKKNLRESLLGKIYMDQNLVKGIDLADEGTKEKIYQQYLAAFKKGVFDYIKEDIDPATQQTIPRRYFSGGLEGYDQAMIAEIEPPAEFLARTTQRQHVREQVRFDLVQPDAALITEERNLPIAYLADPTKIPVFNALVRAFADYNLTGETDERFTVIASGHSRRTMQIPNEFPNLVFKLGRFDEQSEPPAADEPLIMSALAHRFGYTIVVIDGFELIKIEGIAPFRYHNDILVQAYGEPATDVRHFEEVKATAQRVGLNWELADTAFPESQLKNIALVKEVVDGVERKTPMITDNKNFTYPDAAMMSDTKITSYGDELGISPDDIAGAVAKFPQLADLNPARVRTDFETELGIEKKELAAAIITHPPLAGYDPARVREDFKKELGIEKADLAQAIIRFPPLAGLDPARVRDEFQRELGIERDLLAQAIITNPQLAGYDPARFREDFLTELGITTPQLVKALLKFPALANYDIARVKADYRREFGIKKSALARAILKYPQLASLNAARIRKEFEEELGIEKEALAKAIVRFPSLVGYNVKQNLKAKLEIITQLSTPAEEKLDDLLKIVSKNTAILQHIVAVAKTMDYTIENGSNLASIYKRLNRVLTAEQGNTGPALLKAKPENLQSVIEPVIRQIIADWKQKSLGGERAAASHDEETVVPDEAVLAQTKPAVLDDQTIVHLAFSVPDETLIRQIQGIRDTLANGQLEKPTTDFIYDYLDQTIEHANPLVRQASIEALGELGTHEALFAITNRENTAEWGNADPVASIREAEYDAIVKILTKTKKPLAPFLVNDLLFFIIERPRERAQAVRQKRTLALQQIAVTPGVSAYEQWRIVNYIKADLNPQYEPPEGRLLITQALARIGTTEAAEAIVWRGSKTRIRPYEPQSAVRTAQMTAIRQILNQGRISPVLVSDVIAFAVQEGLHHMDAKVRASSIYLLIDLAFSGITRAGQKEYILHKLMRHFRWETDTTNARVLVKAIPLVNATYQASRATDQALLATVAPLIASADRTGREERILGTALSQLPESMFDFRTRILKAKRAVQILEQTLSRTNDQPLFLQTVSALLTQVKETISREEEERDQTKRELALINIFDSQPEGAVLQSMLDELALPTHVPVIVRLAEYQQPFLQADANHQNAFVTILETVIRESAFTPSIDHAMTAANPNVRLDIAAAKLALTTDTQMFNLLITRVPDNEILPIILDVRRAKEDSMKGGLFTKNVFLSFDALSKSKYAGVKRFAEIIRQHPEVVRGLDTQVQRVKMRMLRGIVTPTKRRAAEKRISELAKLVTQPDANASQTAKKDMAAVKLGIASNRQIRKIFIGKVDIRQIPLFLEKIIDIRENNPSAFDNFNTLSPALGKFSALLTPETIERINNIENLEDSLDKLGLIENSDFAQDMYTHIAVLKAGQADAETLMIAFTGEFADNDVEELAVGLAEANRLSFTGLTAFNRLPGKLKNPIINNKTIQNKIDQLVVGYQTESQTELPKTRISIQRETAPVILQGSPVTRPRMRSLPDLRMHRFKSKADLERLFQEEINKFPLIGGVRQYSEFGAMLIRPKGERKNKLTHVVFPQTAISIPSAGLSLRGHTSRTFPQVVLMGDSDTNALYAKVMADRMTVDGFPQRVSLVYTMDQAFFNTDIWNTLAEEDKKDLSRYGFGPGMTPQQWGEAINRYLQNVYPMAYALNGKFINARELPIPINRFGLVGTLDSWHMMPEFIVAAINNNRFVFEGMDTNLKEEEIPYEIGALHIHPEKTFEGLDAELAKRLGKNGDEIVAMTPSPSDIVVMRSGQSIYSELNLMFQNRDINTSESFLGLIRVDRRGNVTGSRYLDFGDFGSEQELDKMAALNKRTMTTLGSRDPDLGIVAEHYRYINSFTKDDFGTQISSPHIGDNDNAMLSGLEDENIDLAAFRGKTDLLREFARELRSIQSKTIVDYNRIDELNTGIDAVFKQISRLPPVKTKEFRMYVDTLTALFMTTPLPENFEAADTRTVHRELSRILGGLAPESMEEAQRAFVAALSRYQSPLGSRNLGDKLNKGFPVVLQPLADTKELSALQRQVNGTELNLTVLKGKTKSLVLVSLGAEEAVRSLTFLADLPGYTDIHTHGYELPEPSSQDTDLSEKLAETPGRASMIIGFNRTGNDIGVAEFTPQRREWVTLSNGQTAIAGRLMEIGLFEQPLNLHITAQSKISEVDPVEKSSATNVRQREDLDRLIDPPLLEAIKILYDKNILTEASSANRRDVKKGEVYIHIPYAELSDVNQLIAMKIGQWITPGVKAERVFAITIPIDADTTVGELSAKAVEIAEQFKKQPLTWAVTHTLQEMRTSVYRRASLTIAEAVADGWYYDAANETFYLSEEQYRKVQEGRDEAMMAKSDHPLTQRFAGFTNDSQFLLNKISRQGHELMILAQRKDLQAVRQQMLERIERLITLVNSMNTLPAMLAAHQAGPAKKNDPSPDAVLYNTVADMVLSLETDLKSVRNQVNAPTDPKMYLYSDNLRERIRTFEQNVQDTMLVLRELGHTDHIPLIQKSEKVVVFTQYQRYWLSPVQMNKEFLRQTKLIGVRSAVVGEEAYGFLKIEHIIDQLNVLNSRMVGAQDKELEQIQTEFTGLVNEIKKIIDGFSTLKLIKTPYPYPNARTLLRTVVRNTIIYIIEEDLSDLLKTEGYLASPGDAAFFLDDLGKRVARAKHRLTLLTEAAEFSFIEPPLFPRTRVDIDALDPRRDEAMTAATKEVPGGIDFNPDNFDLQQSGETNIQFNIPEADLPAGTIQGIVPVIINITPVTNFPLLLGYTQTENGENFTRTPGRHTAPLGRPEDQLSFLSN